MATVLKPETKKGPQVSRRGVLATMGALGGLTFCMAAGVDGLHLVGSAKAQAAAAKSLNPWVRILPDGTTFIYSAGAEMGQGSLTSLAAIVADEMDADWSKVTIEFAPSDVEIYGYRNGKVRSMAITGSRAVQKYYDDLRIAGAQVRKVLINAAAKKWNVDPATLKTELHAVVDPASGRKLSYGEIAGFAEMPAELPKVEKSELKQKADFNLIGKSQPKRDIPAKVNGTAQYSIDLQLPGMVYATVLHSPVQNGAPDSWNDAEIRAMKGVLDTVRLKDGVAVVTDTWEHALAARHALNVTWKKGKAAGFDSEEALDDEYIKIHADPQAKVQPVDSKGDVKAAFAGAAKTYRADYLSDFGYHAQMEPLNAVARFNEAGNAVEVWEGTQAPDRTRADVAKALGFKLEQVTHHQCYMGGGFGRRSIGDYASEAALIARDVKRPVKLLWTREEDVANGMFRPQSFQCLEGAMDESGKVVGWQHCVVGDGGPALLVGGMKIPYYGVPNQHLELRGVSHGVKLKHWRGVAHVFNVFAIESFVDEMAASQNMDPLEFRLKHMALPDRTRAVFEKVAEMSDWKAKRPDGRALGLSISERSGSLGAGVAEISLDHNTGKIRVHKTWLAIDGGLIVQPEAAKGNVESGILYGMSSVLFERITMKDGVVEQSNFHDYHVIRMEDAPEEIHITFLDTGTAPTGLGEIGHPWIAAAVANGFFKLTGKRLRHMPFTPERVLEALKA
jgi:isoquinoline 1-oxidoreductase beta subunit